MKDGQIYPRLLSPCFFVKQIILRSKLRIQRAKHYSAHHSCVAVFTFSETFSLSASPLFFISSHFDLSIFRCIPYIMQRSKKKRRLKKLRFKSCKKERKKDLIKEKRGLFTPFLFSALSSLPLPLPSPSLFGKSSCSFSFLFSFFPSRFLVSSFQGGGEKGESKKIEKKRGARGKGEGKGKEKDKDM